MQSGTPLGTVSLSIDGTDFVSSDLPFSLSAPAKVGVDIGLTFGSTNVSGTVTFDEVVFEIKP